MQEYFNDIKLEKDKEQRVWKEFYVSKLFDIKTGSDLILSKVSEGEFPITSNKIKDNSVAKYSSEIEGRTLFDCTKTISVADRGKFYASVQIHDFYIGTRVKALVALFEECDTTILCFIATIINQEEFRFNYGRNCCDRFKDLIINLPIVKGNKDCTLKYSDKGYIPDFQFMKDYINEKLSDKRADISYISDYFLNEGYDKACWYMDNIDINKFNSEYCPKIKIETVDLKLASIWEDFKLADLFEVTGTATTKVEVLNSYGRGYYPYVTTQSTNNGVKSYYDYFTEKGNILTIDSATIGSCFYQDRNFSASDHVEKLVPKFKLNQFIGEFLSVIIQQEMFRYGYGRKFNQKRIKNTILKLPAKAYLNNKSESVPVIDKSLGYHPDGYIPDFKFMENYIKSLPFTKGLEVNS